MKSYFCATARPMVKTAVAYVAGGVERRAEGVVVEGVGVVVATLS